VDFNHTIDANEYGEDNGGFGKNIEESIIKIPGNLKENLGARLLNAPKNLESGDVGLKFRKFLISWTP
jgi:hypothetical protein